MVSNRYQNVKKGHQTLNMVRVHMKSVDKYQNEKTWKFFQVLKLFNTIFSNLSFFNTWKLSKFFPAQTSIEHLQNLKRITQV